MTDKYEDVFSGIIYEIKTLNGGKELFYEKKNARILVNTDDDISLNKPLKFPMLLIIIRCILQKGEKFVIIDTLKILVLSMNCIFVMVVMIYCKNC